MNYKGEEVSKYWYDICELRDSLEYEILHRDYENFMLKVMMKKFIKNLRKDLYGIMLRVEDLKFETLLIKPFKGELLFITDRKELMLYVVKYAYKYTGDALNEFLDFLESDKIFCNRFVYKYEKMITELYKYNTGSSIPMFVREFYNIIESVDMKKLIRKKKLEKINKLNM